jgi:rhodanese-related sulfurtransferase
MKYAEACDRIAGVLDPSENAQHIFDMRSFQEFEPAIFHERDVPAGELHLELIAMVARPKQHRLALQCGAANRVRGARQSG